MTPLGYWLGVKKKQKAVPVIPNPVLESYYEKNGITSNNNLEVSLVYPQYFTHVHLCLGYAGNLIYKNFFKIFLWTVCLHC